MVLVDTLAEQRLLEDLLEGAKPSLPDGTAGLHYLLATPFRYPPTAFGSRFRRPEDPGVFYGADAVRTACAELGYWRWRFLLASPALDQIEPAPQTIFQVSVRGATIDLREPPYHKQRKQWTDPADYRACQAEASAARTRGIGLIRYQSVRDPESGGATAVLAPTAFVETKPRHLETWYLGVTRERVRWTRERFRGESLGFDFSATGWAATG